MLRNDRESDVVSSSSSSSLVNHFDVFGDYSTPLAEAISARLTKGQQEAIQAIPSQVKLLIDELDLLILSLKKPFLDWCKQSQKREDIEEIIRLFFQTYGEWVLDKNDPDKNVPPVKEIQELLIKFFADNSAKLVSIIPNQEDNVFFIRIQQLFFILFNIRNWLNDYIVGVAVGYDLYKNINNINNIKTKLETLEKTKINKTEIDKLIIEYESNKKLYKDSLEKYQHLKDSLYDEKFIHQVNDFLKSIKSILIVQQDDHKNGVKVIKEDISSIVNPFGEKLSSFLKEANKNQAILKKDLTNDNVDNDVFIKAYQAELAIKIAEEEEAERQRAAVEEAARKQAEEKEAERQRAAAEKAARKQAAAQNVNQYGRIRKKRRVIDLNIQPHSVSTFHKVSNSDENNNAPVVDSPMIVSVPDSKSDHSKNVSSDQRGFFSRHGESILTSTLIGTSAGMMVGGVLGAVFAPITIGASIVIGIAAGGFIGASLSFGMSAAAGFLSDCFWSSKQSTAAPVSSKPLPAGSTNSMTKKLGSSGKRPAAQDTQPDLDSPTPGMPDKTAQAIVEALSGSAVNTTQPQPYVAAAVAGGSDDIGRRRGFY